MSRGLHAKMLRRDITGVVGCDIDDVEKLPDKFSHMLRRDSKGVDGCEIELVTCRQSKKN